MGRAELTPLMNHWMMPTVTFRKPAFRGLSHPARTLALLACVAMLCACGSKTEPGAAGQKADAASSKTAAAGGGASVAALAPGLAETPPCPAGVRAASSTEGVRLDLTLSSADALTSAAPSGPRNCRFHVVLPAHAALVPEILDYRLEPLAADAAPTTRSAAEFGDRHRRNRLAEPVPEFRGPLTPASEPQYGDLRAKVAAALQAEEAGIARFWRIVCVTVAPAPIVVEGLGAYRLASLSVRFAAGEPAEPDPIAAEEAGRTDWGIARLVRRVVANPDGLALYGRRDLGADADAPLHAADGASPPVATPDGTWLRLAIAKDGMVALTRHHLEAAGLSPSTVDPRAIRIYSRGKQVPSLLLGPATNRFSSDTSLVFYGLASRSVYSCERVYWVRCDSGAAVEPAVRMAMGEAPALTREDAVNIGFAGPAEELVEEDNELEVEQGDFLSIKASHWVWGRLSAADKLEARFDLPFLVPSSPATATLVLRFYNTDFPTTATTPLPGIGLEVVVNDQATTASAPLRSDADISRTLVLAVAKLRERGNVVTLRLRQPIAEAYQATRIYFDNLTVRYDRPYASLGGRVDLRTDGRHPWYAVEGFQDEEPYVFDLTDPETPERLPVRGVTVTGYVFHEDRPGRAILGLAPSTLAPAPDPSPSATPPDRPTELADLRDPANAADYLVVYHPMFEEAIQPLLKLHADQGLRVASVGVDRVFEAYSQGELTPRALKDFLRDAVRHWAVPPTYVLFFGDATSDYRNELRTGVPNLVPAYTYTSVTGDRWASELWYAAAIGEDWLPDVALGRLPVENVEDAAEVVRKAVSYTQEPPLGPWRNRFGCLADNAEPGFEFEETARTLCADFVRPGNEVEALYVNSFPLEDNFYVPADVARETNSKVSTEATLALLATLNRGAAMFTFVGHGSPNLWATERVWFGGDSKRSDNLNLRNDGRLPFVASFTCNQGAFDYPKPYLNINISEDMMRVRQGGAIAMYVPSGPGVPTIHAEMAKELMRAVERDGVFRLGEAVTLSRYYSLLADVPPDMRGGRAEKEKYLTRRDEMVRMSVLLGDPALDLVHPAAEALGRVKPAIVRLPESGTLSTTPTLTFEAQVSDPAAGRFTAVVQDPERRTVARCPATAFSGGTVRWSFRLPQSPAPGLWRVLAYCGDDATRHDADVWATFEVQARPAAAPAKGASANDTQYDLSFVADSLRATSTAVARTAAHKPDVPVEGRTVFLHARLANTGRAPSPRFQLSAFRTSREGVRSQIPVGEEGELAHSEQPLAAGAKRDVTLRWDAPTGDEYAGANVVELEIDLGDAGANANAANRSAKVPVRILSRPNVRLVLVPQPGLVTVASATASAPDAQGNRKASVAVRALPELARNQKPDLKLGILRYAPGPDEALDSPHCLVKSFPLKLGAKETQWTHNWSAQRADYPTSPTAVVYREDLDLVRTPTDDGGAELTAKIRVRNYGEAAATHWEVDFYTRLPVTRADLDDPSILIHAMPLEPLAGGEAREVTYTWRPKSPPAATFLPVVLVLRNLETIRSEAQGKTETPDEWAAPAAPPAGQ